MTIIFPRDDIMPAVSWIDQVFVLHERQEFSRQASGVTRGKSFGSALWMTALTTQPLSDEEAVDFEAMLHSLDGVVNGFFAGDLRRPFPIVHSDGVFDDSAAVVHTVGVDNKSLRIEGLPVGFVISRGDYFSVTPSGGSPALYQAMETVTVDGAGISPIFECRPHLHVGTAEGYVVSFKEPVTVFLLEPGSIDPQLVDAGYWRVSLRAVQSI